MDLVPLLTTIILVVTVATLMLAFFTYSLYTVRAHRRAEPESRRRFRYVASRRRVRRTLDESDPTEDAGESPSEAAPSYIAPTSPHPPGAPSDDVDAGRAASTPEERWSEPLPAGDAPTESAIWEADDVFSSSAARHDAPPQRSPHRKDAATHHVDRAVDRDRAGGRTREPDSLFWEYTDEGFVPVDPTRPSASAARTASARSDDDIEDCVWL